MEPETGPDRKDYSDYNCKVELALTSAGRTIVCYHPSVDIPYEHTKPVPQPDILHKYEETFEQVLKTKLEEKAEDLEQGPMNNSARSSSHKASLVPTADCITETESSQTSDCS